MDMLEALKVITELLSGATNTALWAFIFYGFYKLAVVALFVFPIMHVIKFVVTKVFIDEIE